MFWTDLYPIAALVLRAAVYFLISGSVLYYAITKEDDNDY